MPELRRIDIWSHPDIRFLNGDAVIESLSTYGKLDMDRWDQHQKG